MMNTINLDLTAWYAAALTAMALFLALFSLLPRVFRMLELVVRVFVLKHLHYSRLRNRTWGRGDFLNASQSEIILRAFFLASNIATLTVNYQDGRDLFNHAGLLSTINLIPLAFGAHMNPLLNYFGVRLRTLTQTHYYLAWLVLGEALLHAVLAAILHFSPSSRHARVAAIVVGRDIRQNQLYSINVPPGRERDHHNCCVIHPHRPSLFLRMFYKTAPGFGTLSNRRSVDTLFPW